MFVTVKRFLDELHAERVATSNWQADYARATAERDRLVVENTRMRSDLDWFKIRLNQVEKERAQLILHNTGAPLSYPTFTPAQEDPEKALQEIPEFAMVGNDAPEDYSQMPQRTRN
jgi:hypothetical protein